MNSDELIIQEENYLPQDIDQAREVLNNTFENEDMTYIKSVIKKLKDKKYDAYIVGGCVRDLLSNKTPTDWDLATNAKPEEINKIFDHTFSNNPFGTVGVVNEEEKESFRIVEITTFRCDSKYTNKRHPDKVSYCNTIEEDLIRRDFTINAIAYDPIDKKLIDPSSGIEDLNKRIINAVGNTKDRLEEDFLRVLRAARIATETNSKINKEIIDETRKNKNNLKFISRERIRDEFTKIILSKSPMRGILILNEMDILSEISKDLLLGIGCEQRGTHIYDVFIHNLRTLQHSADKNFPLTVRLASLFHDVGKPHTRDYDKEKNTYTFHRHEIKGTHIVRKILKELHYPNEVVEQVSLLVRNHMFFSDTQKVTPPSVRRLIKRVGKDLIWDLMDLRKCDRIGTGRPKEQPYNLRKFQAMIEEVMHDPTEVNMIKINGRDIMEKFNISPSPKIGHILNSLLEEILDDPKKNEKDYLIDRTRELLKLSDDELKKLGDSGKMKKSLKDAEEVRRIRKSYGVS